MSNSVLDNADQLSFEQALLADPVWDGIESGAHAFKIPEHVLLHAGPAFKSIDAISMPILNSACVAAVFEGLAKNFGQAESMIKAGEIQLKPAQDHSVVTPLAAVVSASMPLHRVIDENQSDIKIYAPINGGGAPSLRLGLRSESVLNHIRWLNSFFADLLNEALTSSYEMLPLAAAGLAEGDDCHGRTPHATKLLMAKVEQAIPGKQFDEKTRDFIGRSPSLFLNLWMAASKCIMTRAAGVGGSSFVIAAGGNGVETGIQISALPGHWFSSSATAPVGRFDVDLPVSRGLPAIGDSAVVEGLGLGAMAIRLSPGQLDALGEFLPEDFDLRTQSLLMGQHPAFGSLNCRLGISARSVVAYGRGPVIALGILDNEGAVGRLGGGIYDMPATVFEAAIAELDGH
ncbi:MAG: hypothetical protein ACI845_000017 [Gammaproteobacteria bacterium]|jgi:hypothetical protein